MTTTVIVTLSVEGFHNYPGAKDVQGAEYLADRHRHIFHVKAELPVNHDDRDVEFIIFKRRVEKYMTAKWGMPCEFGSLSCEAIAKTLMVEFMLSSCEIWEDAENGSRVVR